MRIIKYILIAIIIIMLPYSVLATAVTTNAASAIGTDTVTFNANIAGMGGDIVML